MHNRATALAATVLLPALAGAAHAQSAYGPGGLFVHPNALVRAPGDWTAGASWFRQTGDGPTSEWTPVMAMGGIARHWEAGAMLVPERTGREHSVSGGAFAKVQLQGFDGDRPALALSASHIGGPISLSSLAAVGSWKVPGARKETLVHAGLQWARQGGAIRSDATEPFVGVQAPVSASVSVVAEYGVRFSFDRSDRSALGLVWSAPNGQRLAVGMVNTGRSDSRRLFIGVGYPLGGGK